MKKTSLFIVFLLLSSLLLCGCGKTGNESEAPEIVLPPVRVGTQGTARVHLAHNYSFTDACVSADAIVHFLGGAAGSERTKTILTLTHRSSAAIREAPRMRSS